MNYSAIRRVLGSILIIESAFMMPPLGISLYHRENDTWGFIVSILLTLIIGIIFLIKKPKNNQIGAKDALTIVSLGWLLASIFGALPLYISNSTETFIDALFEIISGFTTTGSSILSNVEALPMGILFWRSLTHWIGGMGILVFTVALLPALGIGGFQIFKAESPGPVAGKIAPRIRDTAKILYTTYVTITILEVIMLKIGEMSLYDSFLYTFGTVGTGGFANKSLSVGYYNSTYIHMVIGFFMMFSGINFSLYYLIFKGKIRDALKDEELRLYVGIIVFAFLAIGLNLYLTDYGKLGLSFRDSFFQVSSIMTTTGYATADFDLWPSFSKGILVILMVIGASAGSTAGGMKVIRILVMIKLVKRQIGKIFHPRAVIPIKNGKKPISQDTIDSINGFVALYLIVLVIGTLLISLEGVDLESAMTSVIATLSNIGPGLGFVGPTQSFGGYSNPSKLLLSFLMLLGRLELFTIIALLAPKNWRREI